MISRLLDHSLARLLSLLLAVSLSLVILIYPQFLIAGDGTSQHGLLMILLLSISIGFIHGVGFAPQHPMWKFIFSPFLAWPPMLTGLISVLLE